MKQALGLVEIEGLTTAVVVADTMAKAANIQILGLENTKGLGYMTIKIAGDVGAVTAAVTAGKQIGLVNHKLISWKVIARPSDYVEQTFCDPGSPEPAPPQDPKPQEVPEPIAEALAEPAAESGFEPAAEVMAEPEPDAVTASGTDAITEPEPDAAIEPEPNAAIEPEPAKQKEPVEQAEAEPRKPEKAVKKSKTTKGKK